jgi:hypothetical protein
MVNALRVKREHAPIAGIYNHGAPMSAEQERLAAQQGMDAFIAQQERLGRMIKPKAWDKWVASLPERPDLIEDRRELEDKRAEDNAERAQLMEAAKRQLMREYELARSRR